MGPYKFLLHSSCAQFFTSFHSDLYLKLDASIWFSSCNTLIPFVIPFKYFRILFQQLHPSMSTMHHKFFLVLTVFTAYLSVLPLNINLGAYSPALVVGDGEISFGGKQDVSNLMNALEGAAVAQPGTD